MSITQHPLLSPLIRTLKLPIPIPPRLERTQAPWSEHPLQGESVILGTAVGSLWTDTVLSMLQATGAQQRTPEEADSHATSRMKIGLPVGLRCARHLCASSRHDQGAHLTRPTGDFHGNPTYRIRTLNRKNQGKRKAGGIE